MVPQKPVHVPHPNQYTARGNAAAAAAAAAATEGGEAGPGMAGVSYNGLGEKSL